MHNERTAVFVSYCHADASLVAPVVKLLRLNKSLVFQDIDSIQPGKRWRSEIDRGITDAQLVVVFWCNHANQSEEVLIEWKKAIEQEKDLLPLLLDATPLPPELSEYQWIDFRGMVGANHNVLKSEEPPNAEKLARSSRLSFLVLGITTVVAVGVSLSLYLAPKLESTEILAPNSPPLAESSGSSILPMVSIVLAVTTCVVWYLRRRWKRREVTQGASSQPGEIEHCIAKQLEAEILRRTISRHDFEA